MRITRLRIKNLYGVSEFELDGSSVILEGDNGTGKTSVIHAIKYALTNQADRERLIRQGSKEGEVIIETDSGLTINRRKREEQADYKSVRQNGREVPGPEAMLRTLFTPFQIDPVAFTQMTKAEQNKAILELIEFKWDLNWIKAQFGEIPEWPDYAQHILVVLDQIQAENGGYFQRRQDINREIRNQRAFVEKIAAKLPPKYDASKWENYDLGDKYQELETKRAANKKIDDARAMKESYESRKRGLEAQRDIEIGRIDKAIQNERETLTNDIARLEAELFAAKEKLAGLAERQADKVKAIDAEHKGRMDTLDAQYNAISGDADKEPIDVTTLSEEVVTAEKMKRFLNEYNEMLRMQKAVDNLTEQSNALTDKIEHARSLPGKILETAKIPVDGLTVEGGIPMIHGLPISNLSEGEQLDLCVDVTLSKPNSLQIILLDGIEKLSKHNQERVFEKCRDKGIQFIATATTEADEMEVRYL